MECLAASGEYNLTDKFSKLPSYASEAVSSPTFLPSYRWLPYQVNTTTLVKEQWQFLAQLTWWPGSWRYIVASSWIELLLNNPNTAADIAQRSRPSCPCLSEAILRRACEWRCPSHSSHCNHYFLSSWAFLNATPTDPTPFLLAAMTARDCNGAFGVVPWLQLYARLRFEAKQLTVWCSTTSQQQLVTGNETLIDWRMSVFVFVTCKHLVA